MHNAKTEDNCFDISKLSNEIIEINLDSTVSVENANKLERIKNELKRIKVSMEKDREKEKSDEKVCIMCKTPTKRNHSSETCSLHCQALRFEFDSRLPASCNDQKWRG
jgi:hypothetical protein